MPVGWTERVEEWTWRLYRLEPERLRRETDLRVALLRRLLVATGAACLLYVALEAAGILATVAFPYDAIELSIALWVCHWLLRRGKASTATVLLLVFISHPAGFAIGQYGIRSPAPALLIPSLLVCGLLVGGYFLSTWTAICCLLLVVKGVRTSTLAEPDNLRFLAFWCIVFAAVGWLVHLFSDHLERRWQVDHRQANALGRMLALMTTEQPLAGLMERLAALLRQEFAAASVALCRYHPVTDRMTLIAASRDGEAAATVADSIAAFELPAWKEMQTSGQPLAIARPASDARVSGWPALFTDGSAQLLLLPVVIDSASAGLLAIDRHRLPADEREDVELAKVLVRELALFLQVEQLASDQRRAAVLDERNRMAREIHDSLAQGFTGVVVQLNAAEQQLGCQPEAALQHIATARSLARSSLEEARRSVLALRPQALEQHTLPVALERIARDLTADRRIEVDLQVAGVARALAADLELDVLRVGQEALTNAVRHARCARISMELVYRPTELHLDVRDNGSGAVPDRARSSGAGLRGMEERARRHGGWLCIDGRPGSGTRVSLTVPLR
jgi:signal transduction histidine kinase